MLFHFLSHDTAPQRWPHQAIEEERPVDKHDKAQDLQPFKCLPTQEERCDPDKQCPAGVNSGPGCRTHRPRHGQPKEVKAAARIVSSPVFVTGRRQIIPNANHDEDARGCDTSVVGDLAPSFYQVEIPILACIGTSDGEMQDYHCYNSD